ncbi:MAG TPA: acetyl-CoA synthase subunit gamma, partial [Acidobacteriota bacterium]
RSAFRVVYGPVRAADIRAFVASGYRATPAMRRVGFPLRERLALAPLELAQAGKWLFWILLVLLLGDVVRGRGLSLRFLAAGLPFAGAIVVGTVLLPALLPWIPGRSLAWKGWLSAAVLTAAWLVAASVPVSSGLAYWLLLPPISSFLALNFTGSTTYTSLSGVLKETRIALPLLGASFLAGLVLSFVRF